MGAGHTEEARFAIHGEGEMRFCAAESFRQDHGGVIRRAGGDGKDRVAHGDGGAGAHPQLGRLLGGGVTGDVEVGGEAEPAAVQTLKGEIERHELGEGGGVGAAVGVERLQHAAGLRVEEEIRMDDATGCAERGSGPRTTGQEGESEKKPAGCGLSGSRENLAIAEPVAESGPRRLPTPHPLLTSRVHLTTMSCGCNAAQGGSPI